ncbi:MAG: glycosyl hydrolase family 28-related protein, partial [Vicinamibacterales bacterium]|nr:glycosyl hydrolase family 28-related protein [Vicinamibacterales bacterium]
MPSRASTSRRDFLRYTGLAGAATLLPAAVQGFAWPDAQAAPAVPASSAAAWARCEAILARIAAPTFPARDFDITAYGAIGDGVALCTDAFRKAIEVCHDAGGGRVVVPAGRFLTGAIHLRSGVNLHVSDGATVAFSRDPRHYLPLVFTRWEGVELMNYSPLIYAFGQERIAVTGRGTLDGQADQTHWWPWKGLRDPKAPDTQGPARARLFDMGERGVPVAERVFGDGAYLRPNFVQPYRCAHVLIEGVRIINSPMWEIHPVLC